MDRLIYFIFIADTKNSSGIIANSIEEVAHNAVTIMWKPMEEKAKVTHHHHPNYPPPAPVTCLL